MARRNRGRQRVQYPFQMCQAPSLCKWQQQNIASGPLHFSFGRPLQTCQKSAPHATKAERQKSLSAPSSFASMSQPISESLAILSASVVPALEDTSNVAAKVSIASSEYVAASHRLDAVLNDAAQIRKNVLPRLRFCPTNDRWAPIWWNLLLLPMPRKHLQPQRLHFRFLKFAMASYRFGPISLPVSTVLH